MTVPKAIATFLAKHPKKPVLVFTGEIESFDGEDHEIEIDPKGADAQLAGEDGDFDDTVAIGFIADVPILVDTSRKTLPVFAWAEGARSPVSPAFASFERALKPMAKRPAAKGALLEPKTVSDPLENRWPNEPCLVWQLSGGGGFLWVDPQRLRPPALRNVYYNRIRKGLSAAKQWKSVELKYDRGTGAFLDVARFDAVPLVTPRVRAMLEKFPLPGVEFLQLRVNIKNKKGDYFIVHPTKRVDCLDRDACGFPADPTRNRYGEDPDRLVIKPNAIPKDAAIFRATGFARPILVRGELAESLRVAKLSGIGFRSPSAWRPTD